MVDTVIVRSNSLVYDSHIERIVRSLKKRYSITVLGWNRQGLLKEKIYPYIVDNRLFNLKAPIGKPTLIVYFPLFWIWTLIQLCIYRPKIVHACDLDTFLPCYIYKTIFRKRIIFDVFDRYAMVYIPARFKVLHNLVNSFEEICSKRSDALVNVSQSVLNTFKKRPKLCPIVMNCVDDFYVQKSNVDNQILILVYTGPIVRNRGFEAIVDALKGLDKVELIIAGAVIDEGLLNYVLSLPNIRYIGHVKPKEALSLEASAHAIIGIYDLNVPNYRIAVPMKLLEAMMLGIPMITTTASELINESDCGIVVSYNDVNQIRQAITKLRDDKELRQRLGDNARKAFLQKYNWSVMEQELYKTYDILLRK